MGAESYGMRRPFGRRSTSEDATGAPGCALPALPRRDALRTISTPRRPRDDMTVSQALVLIVYYAMLAVVATVMLYRALLVARYYGRKGKDAAPPSRFAEPPIVTVQLPVFNERFVVERLLESVAALDWPKDRLEIQLLDDSTDDTTSIAARKVADLVARGFD